MLSKNGKAECHRCYMKTHAIKLKKKWQIESLGEQLLKSDAFVEFLDEHSVFISYRATSEWWIYSSIFAVSRWMEKLKLKVVTEKRK